MSDFSKPKNRLTNTLLAVTATLPSNYAMEPRDNNQEDIYHLPTLVLDLI